MASITIKDIPEKIHSGFKRFAKEQHRSVNQALILLMKEKAETVSALHEQTPEERLAFVRANRVTPKTPITREDLDRWKNELRS